MMDLAAQLPQMHVSEGVISCGAKAQRALMDSLVTTSRDRTLVAAVA